MTDDTMETFNDELLEQSNADAQDGVPSSGANDMTQEENRIELLEEEKKELQDKYLRLYSEFENYRRRTAKEGMELRQLASKDLIMELLPVLDDFERGLDVAAKTGNGEAAIEGMGLIYNKLKGILERRGLKHMDSKEKEFDPDLHEALTKLPAPNADMKGKVIDEIEKGYLIHDKVIRHAKVVVAE